MEAAFRLAGVVVESVVIEDTDRGDLLVVAVRPRRNIVPRCGRCGGEGHEKTGVGHGGGGGT
jgi:hypothetical protein